MFKRFWRPEVGFFLVIWLVLLLTGRNSLFRDPGTFWHTVVGERMLTTGELVRSDPFSFTRAGDPWVPQWWIAELGMAVIHRAAGFDGLLLATVTLLAAMYAWLAGRLLRAGIPWMPVALLVVLVIAASSYHFHARPHLFTIAFLGWTFGQLCDVEAGRIPLRRLFWLIPLYVLWVNVHGGVLAGIALVGLMIGLWAGARLLKQPSPIQRWQELALLASLFAGLCATILVNPFGIELPHAWATIMLADLPKLIQEHAPPEWFEPDGMTILVLAGLYLCVFLGMPKGWPRPSWLIPFVFLYLTVGRVRHGPLFAILAGIALAEMLPRCRWWAWLGERSQLLRGQANGATRAQATGESVAPALVAGPWWRPVVLPAVLVAVLATIFIVRHSTSPAATPAWVQLDPSVWPVGVLPQLKETEAREGGRIFNELNLGGFLIYFTPGYQVFIDDRCELYGNEFLLAYDEASRHNPAELDAWQRQYGFRLALVHRGSRLDEFLSTSKKWGLISECPAARFYRRLGNS